MVHLWPWFRGIVVLIWIALQWKSACVLRTQHSGDKTAERQSYGLCFQIITFPPHVVKKSFEVAVTRERLYFVVSVAWRLPSVKQQLDPDRRVCVRIKNEKMQRVFQMKAQTTLFLTAELQNDTCKCLQGDQSFVSGKISSISKQIR